MMKNKKNLGIASLVLSIVSLIPLLLSPADLTTAEIIVVVALLLAIVSVVLGFIAKKDAKGLSIAGIVIGIISAILLCFALVGFSAYKNAQDCVDNGDGTATCKVMGQDMVIPDVYLTDDQMEKGE